MLLPAGGRLFTTSCRFGAKASTGRNASLWETSEHQRSVIEWLDSSRKVGCVLWKVIWSRFRIGQNRDDNHPVGRRTQLHKSVIIVETNLFTEIDTRKYSNPNTKNETKKNYQHCSLISHHWFLYHKKFQIRNFYFSIFLVGHFWMVLDLSKLWLKIKQNQICYFVGLAMRYVCSHPISRLTTWSTIQGFKDRGPLGMAHDSLKIFSEIWVKWATILRYFQFFSMVPLLIDQMRRSPWIKKLFLHNIIDQLSGNRLILKIYDGSTLTSDLTNLLWPHEYPKVDLKRVSLGTIKVIKPSGFLFWIIRFGLVFS